MHCSYQKKVPQAATIVILQYSFTNCKRAKPFATPTSDDIMGIQPNQEDKSTHCRGKGRIATFFSHTFSLAHPTTHVQQNICPHSVTELAVLSSRQSAHLRWLTLCSGVMVSR